MLKLALGLISAVVLTIFSVGAIGHGARDLKHSWTHWEYPVIRDMRHTVAILPQKVSERSPDSLTVPTTGWGDRVDEAALEADREKTANAVKNPVPYSDASWQRGEATFKIMCTPCHGISMAGDGTVAPKFMPPPDLLAEVTRARSDGYLFCYIRHGGVVMPRYGQSVSAPEAWDLVNYVRHMQKVSPR